ncbi:MAG: hypothetical protein R3Y63_08355 [Eubacteriales bacterium]
MKSGMKMLLTTTLLLSLVSCGETEEVIVYEPSPYDLPVSYTLSESDTAPVFFADVFSYIEKNVLPVPEVDPYADMVELTKEEEKAKAAEQELIDAENELLQKELDAENAKLASIRLVSIFDPSENNALVLADALIEYEEYVIATLPSMPAATETETEGESEEQLSNEGEATLSPTVDETPVETVTIIDEMTFLQDYELESFVYTYDVTSTGYTGGQATAGYVSFMNSSGFKVIDSFHPVDGEHYEMLTPDFTQRAGTVCLGKKASGTERLMLITVDWNYNGAVVTVEYRDGTIWVAPPSNNNSKGSLSIDDAVAFLSSRSPSELGLSGTTMDSYNVYTAEGLVLINGVSYRKFNITQKSENGNGNVFAGSFLINADGVTFSVDQTTGAVYPMDIINVFDTMS